MRTRFTDKEIREFVTLHTENISDIVRVLASNITARLLAGVKDDDGELELARTMDVYHSIESSIEQALQETLEKMEFIN